MRKLALLCLSLVCVSSAHADEVHLVGGSVIEGKVTRQGEKVVIALESGELTLSADSVERVETRASVIDTFDARYAKLKRTDIAGRLALADFCRDHQMHGREIQLLAEVLSLEPNNEQARIRLGYTKTAAGWVPVETAMRQAGMVFQDGRYRTPQEALELSRLRAQTETAQTERDKARLELKTAEAEARQREKRAQESHPQPSAAAPPPPQQTAFVYAPVYGGALRDDACTGKRCGQRAHSAYNFPIAGVRDPRDPGYLLPPGVRDPRSYR